MINDTGPANTASGSVSREEMHAFLDRARYGFRLRIAFDKIDAKKPSWWRVFEHAAWKEERAKAWAALLDHMLDKGPLGTGGTKRGVYSVDLKELRIRPTFVESFTFRPARQNVAYGMGSIAIGSNNTATHDNSILIGEELVSDHISQIKIGVGSAFITYDPPAEERERFKAALMTSLMGRIAS